MVPVITCLINASITQGIVPAASKEAVVTPILKKVGSDLIKITERDAPDQMQFPMSECDFRPYSAK